MENRKPLKNHLEIRMPCVDVSQFHLDQVFHHGVSGRQPASQKVGHHIYNLLVESGESQHLLLNLKLKEKIFNKWLNHIKQLCLVSGQGPNQWVLQVLSTQVTA